MSLAKSILEMVGTELEEAAMLKPHSIYLMNNDSGQIEGNRIVMSNKEAMEYATGLSGDYSVVVTDMEGNTTPLTADSKEVYDVVPVGEEYDELAEPIMEMMCESMNSANNPLATTHDGNNLVVECDGKTYKFQRV